MDAQTLALFIAGILAPYITELLKRGQVEGKKALWLAFVVSVVLAIGALLVTGGLSVSDPTQFAGAAGAVFSLATIIYKQFIS